MRSYEGYENWELGSFSPVIISAGKALGLFLLNLSYNLTHYQMLIKLFPQLTLLQTDAFQRKVGKLERSVEEVCLLAVAYKVNIHSPSFDQRPPMQLKKQILHAIVY